MSEVVERIQRAAKKDAKLDLFYPRAATLEEIQGWLGAGEALVLYGLCLDEGLAMVLTREDARIVALGKASDVTAACEALDLDAPKVDPSGALAALRRLLVAPLGLRDDVRRVLVSPEGPLSYVPMAALFDREVAYQPSGTTYGLLLEDRARRGEQVLALGDPDYAAKFGSHAMDAYAREFLARIHRPGVEAYATYVGFKNLSALIEEYDQAVALVHTPTAESFGLVVAEAIGRNLKFFGTAVGGIPDIASGVEGADLFPEGDWDGLKEAIARWVQAGCTRPKAAGQIMRQRYHPEVIAGRHLEIYREVLSTCS